VQAVPAVVAAGDRRAAKAVYGDNKVFLEVGGHSLVAHAVLTLQRVPEVSEVWVVGNAARLEAMFRTSELQRELSKPLHIVEQFRNLYENVWQTFRRLLPDASPEGRDPKPADEDQQVLYLSGDLPFATPEEISQFIRRAQQAGCDYALGLVTEEALEAFYPMPSGEPGIRMAYFNIREGRFRQSNLHLVRPARLGNRYYIEEMYQHRYQRQFGHVVSLAWRLLRSEAGGLRVVAYYALMHGAAFMDRLGWRRLADVLRRGISFARVEDALGKLLGTTFRFVVTDLGGCALDVDNEHDYDVAMLRFAQWRAQQRERAAALLHEQSGAGGSALV